MKLFVTGATGFLGRNILRKLEEEGYDTTGLLLPHEDAAGVALSRVVRGDGGRVEAHEAAAAADALRGDRRRAAVPL